MSEWVNEGFSEWKCEWGSETSITSAASKPIQQREQQTQTIEHKVVAKNSCISNLEKLKYWPTYNDCRVVTVL